MVFLKKLYDLFRNIALTSLTEDVKSIASSSGIKDSELARLQEWLVHAAYLFCKFFFRNEPPRNNFKRE